jgi:hypothetical protein
MHRKYTTMKNAISVYGGTNKHRPVERDPSHPDFQSIASKYHHDPERSRQRMRMREERLKARESYDLEEGKLHNHPPRSNTINSKSFRYMRRQPTIVQYDQDDLSEAAAAVKGINNNETTAKPGGGGTPTVNFNEIGIVATGNDSVHRRRLKASSSNSVVENTMAEDGPGKKMQLKKPLEIYIDGPFGAPSSNIFRAEHAVLIGTGIGVTPFASILQCIMHRYWQVKRQCPQCQFQWSDEISSIFNLKKVGSLTAIVTCSITICHHSFSGGLLLDQSRPEILRVVCQAPVSIGD